MKWGRCYSMSFRVQFEEVDMLSTVHHPNYLKYLERARCLAMAEEQYPFERMIEQGFGYVVADAQLRYKAPLLYNDCKVVYTQIFAVGAASLRVRQMIRSPSPWPPSADGADNSRVQDAALDASGFQTGCPDPEDWPQLPGCDFWADLVLVHYDLKRRKSVPFHQELLQMMGVKSVASADQRALRSRQVRLV
jgi:YbgC/YbaW family acyl-CoA thioester hydrolase